MGGMAIWKKVKFGKLRQVNFPLHSSSPVGCLDGMDGVSILECLAGPNCKKRRRRRGEVEERRRGS
jgi:hypothetical protein